MPWGTLFLERWRAKDREDVCCPCERAGEWLIETGFRGVSNNWTVWGAAFGWFWGVAVLWGWVV